MCVFIDNPAFIKDISVVFFLSKTNNTGHLFLPVQTLKALLNLLVRLSLSVLLPEMTLTCYYSFCLSVLPLLCITLYQSSHIVAREGGAAFRKQSFEDRDVFHVGTALVGCIQGMPVKYLKMIVSFLESILGLRAQDNRGIVVQRTAKTKALSGLC